MITDLGKNKIVNNILAMIDHCEYKLDSVNQTVAIQTTKVDGNTLVVYFWLDDSVTGQITEINLIDKDGDIFASKTDYIEKPDVKGLLISFKFTINEVV